MKERESVKVESEVRAAKARLLKQLRKGNSKWWILKGENV